MVAKRRHTLLFNLFLDVVFSSMLPQEKQKGRRKPSLVNEGEWQREKRPLSRSLSFRVLLLRGSLGSGGP